MSPTDLALVDVSVQQWSLSHVYRPFDRARNQHQDVGVDAIATRAGLQGWNTSRVTGDGALGTEWTLSYVGGPDFVWRVDRDDASGVRWTCTRGPGDSVGTTVEFALAPTQDGRTRISLTHGGWPHREGNFTKCNTLWGAMLFQLKAFAESGKPAPAHG